jgi:nitrate/nitrite transporter NarK
MRWFCFVVVVVALLALSLAERAIWTGPVFVLVGVLVGFLRGANFAYDLGYQRRGKEDESW